MHHIQKLDIVGFKSFCDRTQLSFGGGVTAIVGPNGCGKSNIADAIHWVVGGQSAKSLRTDKMEGVIFNGTQARKATNMAEVSLTLSLEHASDLPEGLSLSLEGFTVGRRLYRSGESEYYLDGRRCRLKDIQALFEGTGLGPNSYALIEQGRIERILSSRPADRRSLLEEAARITLFRSRRYSAEAKLEAAEQNLVRVRDIVREVVRQLNSLKRQAAKARRYRRLREELRTLHKRKLVLERRALDVQLGATLERFSKAQAREKQVLSDIERVDASRHSHQDSCLAQEKQVNGHRDELTNLKLQAERATHTLQHLQSQKSDLQERIQNLEQECDGLETRKDLIQRERERLGQSVAALEQELLREQTSIEQARASADSGQLAIRETEARMEESRSLLLNGAGELADLRNLRTRCQENIHRVEVRSERLQQEKRAKGQEREDLLAQVATLRRQQGENLVQQQTVTARQHEAERQLGILNDKLAVASSEISAQKEEHGLLTHRYTSLEEIEERRSNYSEGVQKFLSSQTAAGDTVPSQTLADHIETEPQFESAVEDYLNDPLQYILVGRIQDAVQNVEQLKRIGAGKCTFLTLANGHREHARPRPSVRPGEGVVGYLDDLLRMRQDVREAFQRALPDVASTVMVLDLETAFRVAQDHPEGTFLTLSGETYSSRGLLSAVGERKPMAGLLALKREKKDLESKLSSIREKMQGAQTELHRLETEQASFADRLKTEADQSRQLELSALQIKHHLDRGQDELGRLEQMEVVTDLELSQLVSEKTGLASGLAEAEEGMQRIEDRSRVGNEELKELNASLDSLRSDSLVLSKNLADRSSEYAVAQERKASSISELDRLVLEGKEIGGRLEENRRQREESRVRIANIDQSHHEITSQTGELSSSIEQTERALTESQSKLSTMRDTVSGLDSEIRTLHATREEAMEERNLVEVEKTRLERDIEHSEQVCREEFHVELGTLFDELSEDDQRGNTEEVSSAYEQLRERVENFGAINMRAFEEYQELEERYQFLTGQQSDIEQSIADTQKAIAEINRRSLERFQDAFTHVRANFKEVFRTLFGGGFCDLKLTDEGDVLESGIDIVAQPPGKRLQNVLLLSGGEKALTALALLIAIFQYRPSPFCVLDEVDAPLDDANVDRFVNLISELSQETQFLLVTHNKKTMELASSLHGVTMEEAGVSKIVGVDFHRIGQELAS